MELLEHKPYFAAPNCCTARVGECGDVGAVQQVGATGWDVEAAKNVEER